jgi:hypothetical protein
LGEQSMYACYFCAVGKSPMFEIAQDFERAATSFSPVITVVLGLACVVVGLFVWLGGLGFRKLLVAIVGAAAGAICAFFIIGKNFMPAMAVAVIAAGLAVILEQIFIAVLTAALAALSTLFVIGHLYEVDFANGLKHACTQLPIYCWPIIAAVLIIFVVAGFYLWRPTSALCCAALGTILVFAGMILLLSHKGTRPVSYISSRSSFFAAVFVAMVAFGTLEQLLFCKPPKWQPWTKRRARSTSDPDAAHTDWRNR